MCTICQRSEHPTEEHYNACVTCGKAESHVNVGHYIKNPAPESCCESYYESPDETREPTEDERSCWNAHQSHKCPDHICRPCWSIVVIEYAIQSLKSAQSKINSLLRPGSPYKTTIEKAEPDIEDALAFLCDEFDFEYSAKKAVLA